MFYRVCSYRVSFSSLRQASVSGWTEEHHAARSQQVSYLCSHKLPEQGFNFYFTHFVLVIFYCTNKSFIIFSSSVSNVIVKKNHNVMILSQVVFKTVNWKPICRPKDTDLDTFCFLPTKTGFFTYSYFNMILPKYSTTANISQYFIIFYQYVTHLVLESLQKAHHGLFTCGL